MTVVVVEGVAHEVVADLDPAAGAEAAAEVRMVEVDAGVHDRHADAVAGQSEGGAGDVAWVMATAVPRFGSSPGATGSTAGISAVKTG